MKQFIAGVAIATVALSSCSKEEVVSTGVNNTSDYINFSTYALESTKGLIVDNTAEFGAKFGTAERGGFGVTAYTSTTGFDSKYMEAQINLMSGVWNYVNESQIGYWPTEASGSTLDFYAHAPFIDNQSTEITHSKADGMTVKFTAPTAEDTQVDFMYATAYDVKKTRDEALADNRVNLMFKHALTQIKFKGITTSANLKVDVAANGIQMVNIPNTGTLTVPSTAVASTWAVPATPSVAFPITSPAVPSISTAAENISTNNPSIVIPQDITPWKVYTKEEIAAGATPVAATAQDGAYLTIECKAYVQDPVSGVKEYLHGTEGAYATAYVSFDDMGLWLQGQIVTYTLNFDTVGDDEGGEDNLIRIDFNAEAADWTNAEHTIDM